MNITFYKKRNKYFSFTIVLCLILFGIFLIHYAPVYATEIINEPVQACIIAQEVDLTNAIRARYAECLGWKSDHNSPVCLGAYQPLVVQSLSDTEQIRVQADNVSIYKNERSELTGHVEVQQAHRIVNAQTAYIYRNAKTNQITKIEFLGDVHYLEPGKLMIARKATINPEDNSGQTEDAIYRFNTDRRHAMISAWGQARLIQRFPNKDYLLRQVTYTTCAPQDKAWDIKADSIAINHAKSKGVAKNAVLRIHEWPILYTPYLSFPTNKERKSGFLMPLTGYSNVGGFDLGLPYYLNLAPNYDLTLVPHLYTRRGMMLGEEFRYLTPRSTGIITGNFLPHDRAFKTFIQNNEIQFPYLSNLSTNRWSYGVFDSTNITPNLHFNLNLQRVSDDYYLQDFSTNWSVITQRQLLNQADLTYTTEHWVFRGMGQSYQTLHPINEIPIASVYERVPQIMARGFYYDLPFDTRFNILAQYDQFRWSETFWNTRFLEMPEGPRFHLNPILSLPLARSWGFITAAVQFVENYYEVLNSSTNNDFNTYNKIYNYQYNWYIPGFNFNQPGPVGHSSDFNRFIPRYNVDTGLYFDKELHFGDSAYTQTLEPRLFYLNVPYRNQTPIPVYDSGFMIFNFDQLFRTNRFSGFDRIGDANQLSYALTSRWLTETTGFERAQFSIGQIRYFEDRRVQLCQSGTGFCIDSPYTFGSLSSTSRTSPIASRFVYHFNPIWNITGDYIWDPATRATNNSDLNLRYQPAPNAILNFGYSYLVNGDITQVRSNGTANNALHQALVAFSWPFNERWSGVGAYSQNISKNYSMMSLLGVQYDNCCWAVRLVGGRMFKNLNAEFEPRYNNNVYLQILLKGLGSVANSDPNGVLTTYIPGYNDLFRR